MDCSTVRVHKFSRQQRALDGKLPSESIKKRVSKFRAAYSSLPPKLNFELLRERSISSSKSSSTKCSTISGSSFTDITHQSVPGTMDLDGGSSLSLGGVSSMAFGSLQDDGTVQSIIQQFKTARDNARLGQAENSAVDKGKESRGGIEAPRPRIANMRIFYCRIEGCAKAFKFAGDLFTHECRDHNRGGDKPPSIHIPFDLTLHQKRASTTNTMRRAAISPSGPRPQIPAAPRPRTAGISVDVLQQGKKWEEGQLLQVWSEHRSVLVEYIAKLDKEMGKTRDKLPMGPLARKARYLLARDDDD